MDTQLESLRNQLLDHLWDHIIPNMRLLFAMMAPDKYQEWRGNMCRQAAVMTAYVATIKHADVYNAYLTTALMSALDNNNEAKKWDHCYVQFKTREKRLLHIVIDMSVCQEEPIFARAIDYPFYLNKKVCEHFHCPKIEKNISVTNLDSITREGWFDQPEYYTNLSIRQIYEICNKASKPSAECIHRIRRF